MGVVSFPGRMSSRFLRLVAVLGITCFLVQAAALSADFPVREIRSSQDTNHASIQVHLDQRASFTIPKFITGKFAEHLGFNIYHGMDAQILLNPAFAEYPFWNGQMTPDGVTAFQTDETRIADEVRRLAKRFGWPEPQLNSLVRDRTDAMACFWTRMGSRENVEVSPEIGPSGGRAQRIAVKDAGEGVAQWAFLPLHRQRQFDFEVIARSPEIRSLTVALWSRNSQKPIASAKLASVSTNWSKLAGKLAVPADLPSGESYKLTVVADSPGQFVLAGVSLWPSDHVHHADPDIVRFLKESKLPILRWPGGNFVSTYHWEDGIGPVERRPTRPNLAWGGIEPNTFGTDEFVTYCRDLGCEPMICINAGSGSPEEAARWIEYCNGPATSLMGRLRAANGHPEPYGIKHWEVGNELWGHWQMDWTTAAGYVDRFKQFAPAMLGADSNITLYACGAPAMSGKKWNDTVIAGTGFQRITDHPLIGGGVPPSVEAIDVYRDFMAVPEVLQQKWASLRDDMRQGGIQDPKLAVTELQLFAHIGRRTDTNAPVRLRAEQLPGQGSITEAIYDVLIYHAALRLGTFVEMITHSATVNHGGGLRKDRERVWAAPCYYAQAAFADFAEATPVSITIESSMEQAPMVLPDLQHATQNVSFSTLDALAAVGKDGALLLSLVNRGTAEEPLHARLDLGSFKAGDTAKVRTLSASAPWEGNSLENPEMIRPVDAAAPVKENKVDLDIPRYSVLRVRVPAAE